MVIEVAVIKDVCRSCSSKCVSSSFSKSSSSGRVVVKVTELLEQKLVVVVEVVELQVVQVVITVKLVVVKVLIMQSPNSCS